MKTRIRSLSDVFWKTGPARANLKIVVYSELPVYTFLHAEILYIGTKDERGRAMRLSYDDLKKEFLRVLLACHVKEALAEECAKFFADTTQSGVWPARVNQPAALSSNPAASSRRPPERMLSLGAIEQWDAHRTIGNVTAQRMMSRAMELADEHGLGLVALRNATHWMRGGKLERYRRPPPKRVTSASAGATRSP